MSLQACDKTTQLRAKYLYNSQGKVRKTEFLELLHQELKEYGLEASSLMLLEATSLVRDTQSVCFDKDRKIIVQTNINLYIFKEY